jgi:hypothetical protein
VDPRQLETLRRNSGFELDRDGRLWHRGALVEHPGVRAALLGGLTLNEAGEVVLQVPQADGTVQWAYVRCQGTPFVAQAARLDATTLHLRLNTGEQLALPLVGLALRLEGEHDLHVRIHDGEHEARLGRQAWTAVAGDLLPDGDGWRLQPTT